jgi:hypothetical protein
MCAHKIIAATLFSKLLNHWNGADVEKRVAAMMSTSTTKDPRDDESVPMDLSEQSRRPKVYYWLMRWKSGLLAFVIVRGTLTGALEQLFWIWREPNTVQGRICFEKDHDGFQRSAVYILSFWVLRWPS